MAKFAHMRFEDAIADIPNKPPPRAIFCSPVVGEQLMAQCDAVDATEITLSAALGMRIYFDPEMPPTSFDVGYSEDEIQKRISAIRARAADAAARPRS